MTRFADRSSAGSALAATLASYSHRDDVLVLGLPRGGVPVAAEIAETLGAPLDVVLVRKLGAPGQPEVVIGAIAAGGVIVVNENILSAAASSAQIRAEISRQRAELDRRENLYRNGRLPLAVTGRIVILVDDGAATGATMLAAIRAMRKQGARRIVVALPVAATDALATLHAEADAVTCLVTPPIFHSVGEGYEHFEQTSDAEVSALLSRARAPRTGLRRAYIVDNIKSGVLAMKSDSELLADVQTELDWDPSFDDRGIVVAVKDGVVTLAGSVHSYPDKWSAENAAKSVAGVRAVANDIEVKLKADAQRTDREIAEAAVSALKSQVTVPANDIKLIVNDGCVTLEGKVAMRYQKNAAENVVQNLWGVRAVRNHIEIQTKVYAGDIRGKIRQTFKRHADKDADKIQIAVADGTVTLNGTVSSWREREDAESAAWAAPGVAHVKNLLSVHV